jgi:diguanylate cyclase (GGDEF)-like protein/PAS domain S-box-containing protein
MDNNKECAQELPLIVADLQEFVSLCPDPIIAVSRAGAIVVFNSAAERLLGYSADEVIGHFAIARMYPTAEQARAVKKQLYASLDRQIEGCETQLVSKGGRVIDIRLSAKLILRGGEEFGSIGFFHDLTERKELEAALKHMSITDRLTGLHNQRHFLAVLEPETERAKRYGRPLSLICIDMDNFKQVNDVLGHLEGDNALRFTAQTIQRELRKNDMAFRYGGDEFMVLLLETCREDAEVIGRRLQASFDRRWAEEWHPKQDCPMVSMSMGIAEFNQHESPDALMRRADHLMYEAKRHQAG